MTDLWSRCRRLESEAFERNLPTEFSAQLLSNLLVSQGSPIPSVTSSLLDFMEHIQVVRNFIETAIVGQAVE